MGKDKKILYIILYWIIYGGILSVFVAQSEFWQLVPDILVLYLILRKKSVFDFELKSTVGFKVICCFYSFIVIGSVVALFNSISVLSYIWLLRFYLRYWMLFSVVLHVFDKSDISKCKSMLYKALIVNLLLCFIEPYIGHGGDAVGGTFAGGNSELALFLMISIFLVSTDFYMNKISQKNAMIYMLGMISVSIIGEIKFLYFIIPLFIYTSYVLVKKINIFRIIFLAVFMIFFVPAMKYALTLYYDEEYAEKVFDSEEIDNELKHAHNFEEEVGMNRNTAIDITQKLILKDSFHKFFGYGIGSASASQIFGDYIYQNYYKTDYYNFAISYLIIETGWIGFVFYCLVYLFLLFRFFKYYKSYNDQNIKYWSVCGMMACVVTGMFLWYNSRPIFHYYIFYFFFALCMLAIKERIKEIKDIKLNDKNSIYRLS